RIRRIEDADHFAGGLVGIIDQAGKRAVRGRVGWFRELDLLDELEIAGVEDHDVVAKKIEQLPIGRNPDCIGIAGGWWLIFRIRNDPRDLTRGKANLDDLRRIYLVVINFLNDRRGKRVEEFSRRIDGEATQAIVSVEGIQREGVENLVRCKVNRNDGV